MLDKPASALRIHEQTAGEIVLLNGQNLADPAILDRIDRYQPHPVRRDQAGPVGPGSAR